MGDWPRNPEPATRNPRPPSPPPHSHTPVLPHSHTPTLPHSSAPQHPTPPGSTTDATDVGVPGPLPSSSHRAHRGHRRHRESRGVPVAASRECALGFTLAPGSSTWPPWRPWRFSAPDQDLPRRGVSAAPLPQSQTANLKSQMPLSSSPCSCAGTGSPTLPGRACHAAPPLRQAGRRLARRKLFHARKLRLPLAFR